ncbi:MAG: YraN family protein [Pseudomonadota bacterium]|nr:YraN family protein [Pseudomonadota bacterium]
MSRRTLFTWDRSTGARAEQAAARYLIDKGLGVVKRNHRCRHGEIDLICLDSGCLVFVEVRYRTNAAHGDAAETVNRPKQRRLIAAAQHFLSTEWRTPAADTPCRFDIIAVRPDPERAGHAKLRWLRNAFEAADSR